MEGDIMEMSKNELQRWIRDNIKKEELIPRDQLESRLQLMLKKRQTQAEKLMRLCQSVAECETIVRKLYSQLGWEYIDSDHDDKSGSGNISVSSVDCNNQASYSCTSTSFTPLQAKLGNCRDHYRHSDFIKLKGQPVVILPRLPESIIQSVCRPAPQKLNYDISDNESDSDWKLDGDSTDSDFFPYPVPKKRKIDRTTQKPAKSHETPKVNRINNSNNVMETSTNQNTENSESDSSKTSQTNDTTQVIQVSTYPPNTVPLGEISVNMNVLARKRDMQWRRGIVTEILKRENGKLKYKINFKEHGKSLVSGHHLAFTSLPKASQVFIGTRVVVKVTAEPSVFCPGVIAELPDRKNRMRFLVFTDEETPVYVGLPAFHLVCRPLNDPLDDIKDGSHKEFLGDYFKSWPYPLMCRYKVGQSLSVKLNGIQERCEVLDIDSSLIKVVFQKDEHEEWLYRGSYRLQHVFRMKQHMAQKK